MKILFIQLPLIDHAQGYVQGNVQCATSAIAGYIRKRFDTEIRTQSLPFVLSCFGSDDLIIKYVLRSEPDILCFTCYLWNVERNMEIARRIKESDKRIKIIFGGPEISPGSVAFSHRRDYVDIFAAGEGEWFFDRHLSGSNMENSACEINSNRLYTQPPDQLIPAADIVEPFSAKMLDAGPDGSVYLELTRGCPYRCSYCYYSKNCSIVRNLPFEILLDVLRNRKNIREIYILSPAFDKTGDFTGKLKLIAEANVGIRLHSEMRAAGVGRREAGLLFRAGFRSMEVGLQTLNMDALKKIRRHSDPENEIRGIEAMKKAGIDLKIGIIPGLPGDTPDSFVRTIDRLVELGFSDEIEMYPLMVLPGTALRDEAVRDGIDFLQKPPYYFHSGWNFSFDDIVSVNEYACERTGYSMSLTALPNFIYDEEGILCSGAGFDGDNAESWRGKLYSDKIETNLFNFHIRLTRAESLYRGLPLLLEGLPEGGLYNIIIYSDLFFNEDILFEILDGLDSDNFYRRLNVFGEWRDGLRWRLFQINSDPEVFVRHDTLYSIISPILRVNTINFRALELVDSDAPLLVSKGIYGDIKNILLSSYSSSPELVAFEDERDLADFSSATGHENIEYPFSFRMIESIKAV